MDTMTRARLALTGVLLLAGSSIAAACSSQLKSHPPIDDTGSADPGPAPIGKGSGTADAGASNDAGPASDAGDSGTAPADSGSCNPFNCSSVSGIGCCDHAGICQPGTLNSACGTNGFSCAVCDAGLSCQSGFCQ